MYVCVCVYITLSLTHTHSLSLSLSFHLQSERINYSSSGDSINDPRPPKPVRMRRAQSVEDLSRLEAVSSDIHVQLNTP